MPSSALGSGCPADDAEWAQKSATSKKASPADTKQLARGPLKTICVLLGRMRSMESRDG